MLVVFGDSALRDSLWGGVVPDYVVGLVWPTSPPAPNKHDECFCGFVPKVRSTRMGTAQWAAPGVPRLRVVLPLLARASGAGRATATRTLAPPPHPPARTAKAWHMVSERMGGGVLHWVGFVRVCPLFCGMCRRAGGRGRPQGALQPWGARALECGRRGRAKGKLLRRDRARDAEDLDEVLHDRAQRGNSSGQEHSDSLRGIEWTQDPGEVMMAQGH